MGGEYTLVINAELGKLEEVRQFVESSASCLQADERVISDLRLAVLEAVTNTIIHGYKNHQGSIEISIQRKTRELMVRLSDSAPEFDPGSYVTSDQKTLAQRETPGGFGIPLIKQLVDEVSYRVPVAGGNELTLIKHTRD